MQLRRERIAERMRALQELVPNTNKVIIHAIFPDLIISMLGLACLTCLAWNFQQVVQAYDDLTAGFSYSASSSFCLMNMIILEVMNYSSLINT